MAIKLGSGIIVAPSGERVVVHDFEIHGLMDESPPLAPEQISGLGTIEATFECTPSDEAELRQFQDYLYIQWLHSQMYEVANSLVALAHCVPSRNRSRRGWMKRIKTLCRAYYPDRVQGEANDRYLQALHINAEYYDLYDKYLKLASKR